MSLPRGCAREISVQHLVPKVVAELRGRPWHRSKDRDRNLTGKKLPVRLPSRIRHWEPMDGAAILRKTAMETKLIETREWDFPHFNKRDWGKGPWLNEPDKLQFSKCGYPCLVLRNSSLGSLCGYVAVPPGHPAYGLHYEGIDALLADIVYADFMESLRKWGRQGRPLTKHKLPDMNPIERPEPSTDAGKAVASIRVHGGLTYSNSGFIISEEAWKELLKHFPKARKEAAKFPVGDWARFLSHWEEAEHSYEAFKNIAEATTLCLIPYSNTPPWWFFGFDCSHADDLMPAMAYLMKTFRFKPSPGMEFIRNEDVYRDLTYVENECEDLALQLKAIEETTTPTTT